MTSYPAPPARRTIDVQSYLPLVERIARSFLRKVPSHVTAEELVSAGVVGLLEAADRYDSSRGIPFDRFASSRVRGAILDDLRRRDLMARDARSESKKLEHAMDSLTASLGRAPEEAELANELGIEVDALRERLERLAPVQTVGLSEFLEPASDQASPDSTVARAQLIDAVTAALEHLKPRHQQVLALYYYEELTLKDIGIVLEVTESRVSQILTEATLKLRTHLRRAGIMEKDDV